MAIFVFFFQAEDGIRDDLVTGVQTCALPIWELRLRADAIGIEVPRVASGERLDEVGQVGGVGPPASGRRLRRSPGSFRPGGGVVDREQDLDATRCGVT